MVTTTIQLRFDCRATTVRLQFDSATYDHSTTYVTTAGLPVCGPLHWGLEWISQRDCDQLVSGHWCVTSLLTFRTFDKQSNGRRIEVVITAYNIIVKQFRYVEYIHFLHLCLNSSTDWWIVQLLHTLVYQIPRLSLLYEYLIRVDCVNII